LVLPVGIEPTTELAVRIVIATGPVIDPGRPRDRGIQLRHRIDDSVHFQSSRPDGLTDGRLFTLWLMSTGGGTNAPGLCTNGWSAVVLIGRR
jgi:hypothetical protein